MSGKRYFQCEPKKGIFSRLTRLTREPMTSATTPDGLSSMDTSFRSMTSPGRSGTTSPTYSVTSTSKTPGISRLTHPWPSCSEFNLQFHLLGLKDVPEVNDRVIVKSATGSRAATLRYKGQTHFAAGFWCGVEFEDATGRNDGSVSGHR